MGNEKSIMYKALQVDITSTNSIYNKIIIVYKRRMKLILKW